MKPMTLIALIVIIVAIAAFTVAWVQSEFRDLVALGLALFALAWLLQLVVAGGTLIHT